MLNPKISEIIKKSGFEYSDILTYLLSLHFGLNCSYIPEQIKKQSYVLGIVNRDFENKGTVQWTVPLFLSESPNPTTPPSEWKWVLTEFRQMFIDIRKDAGGDKVGCINKMKRFFADNPEIRKEDVIDATKRYLSEFTSGKTNPQYLQKANYFIFKGAKNSSDYQSRLSEYLEVIKTERGNRVNETDRRKKGLL